MADDYILAARNTIASALRHLAALEKLRASDESERSQIQDAYEDVISRGFSAGDQLAEANRRVEDGDVGGADERLWVR